MNNKNMGFKAHHPIFISFLYSFIKAKLAIHCKPKLAIYCNGEGVSSKQKVQSSNPSKSNICMCRDCPIIHSYFVL